MKPVAVLEMLEDAATRLAVRVSYEQLASAGLGGSGNHGGMCRVKGELRVIIDKRATPQERVATLGMALARLDTSALALAPKLRELLDFYADRPSAGLVPGARTAAPRTVAPRTAAPRTVAPRTVAPRIGALASRRVSTPPRAN